jgi:hypothetical protein
MPYLATNARSYEKKSVGDGQCVAFVRTASGAPQHSEWKRGELVKSSNTIIQGMLIATFDPNGKYGSRKDGTCHAAIFIRKSVTGIVVLDQWITNGRRQPVHERIISFSGIGRKINNGNEYYVVE